jgi:hypothetical protein
MKIEHKLDPLLQLSKASDNILTFGCFRVSLLFMLKPVGVENIEEFHKLMARMAKAACDVIEEHYKEEDAKCHTSLDTAKPEDSISSFDLQEKKLPIPPLALEP